MTKGCSTPLIPSLTNRACKPVSTGIYCIKSRCPDRGSHSLKDKAGKPSSSGSAAVCLMRALMMVAVVNPSTSTHRVPEGIASPHFFNQLFAMPVTPNRIVSFGGNDEIFEVPIEHHCNLNPCHAKHRSQNPIRITRDDRIRKDTNESRESDAILAAQMLQSAVFREVHGKSCKCNFACDSDIGCHHCIRSDLKALPRTHAVPAA